jgi:mRNA-degrading endonuclease RelE of RelBE toxin-antitoxin system
VPFHVEISPAAVEHLVQLTARDRSLVLDKIDEQLLHQPDVPTRNRKPMRPNALAPWELRIGSLRVYYLVDVEQSLVRVVAVGTKIRNRVFIGGEEMEL